MDRLRLPALLVSLPCGYGLARWAGLCGPAGERLTWYVPTTTGGVGVVAQQAAALLLDDGDDWT